MSQTSLQVVAARLGALGLVMAAAVVPVATKIGPVVLYVGAGHGLHALDVVLLGVGVPIAVLLLCYAEWLSLDGQDGRRAGHDRERD